MATGDVLLYSSLQRVIRQLSTWGFLSASPTPVGATGATQEYLYKHET